MKLTKRQTRLEVGSSVVRMMVGLIMAAHGFSKLFDFSAWHQSVVEAGIPAPDIMAPLAVTAEILGGIGLILGLVTPLAALAVAIVMVFAIGFVHLGNGLFAQNGGFEYPLLILAVSFFFMLRGGGLFSLDAVLQRQFGKYRHERAEARAADRDRGEHEKETGGKKKTEDRAFPPTELPA